MNKFYTESPFEELLAWGKDSESHPLIKNSVVHFMLEAIENSLYKYVDIATETVADVGVNVGANVGVKSDIINMLKENPALSAKELAVLLKRSQRTIERHIKDLRESGILVRVGADKSGYWQIAENGGAQ